MGRSLLRQYTDNSGPHSSDNGSYRSHRSSTIDYGHEGAKAISSEENRVKTGPWSRDQVSEQRHYSTERHHAADKSKFPALEVVDHPSKAVAETAMEMAQRTLDMISQLGFKGTSQQSEASSSSAGFSLPEARSLETNASTAKTSTTVESAAINKIRQNTSLVKYAFNLPVETESVAENTSSFTSRDGQPSWIDTDYRYGNTFEAPLPKHPRESINYTVADVPTYERGTTVYSQQNARDTEPKVTQEQEPTKTDSCDPTIANILKSIGFNFELSSMMQDKARGESASSSVSPDSSAEASAWTDRVPSIYEEQANRYRAEQMASQYGMPKGMPKTDDRESLHSRGAVQSTANKSSVHMLRQKNDDNPFGEDLFKEAPAADFKLKFKTSDANTDQKKGGLYEDFSDSDDDFTAPANVDANIEGKPNAGLVSQSTPSLAAFWNEGMVKQMTASKTANDIDWELSTEKFIRQLQQPRQPERTVTVGPKPESLGRSVAVPPPQREHLGGDISDNQSENFKLSKSFVPLAELKTIRKTIIVSDSKAESSVGKSDSSSAGKSAKKTYPNSSNREKTPKSQQRNEGPSKSTEKASIDDRRKTRLNDLEERDDKTTTSSKVTKLDINSADGKKEKQKKIDALLRELENLRRQQSILMRRKKRDKDAHKDPFLMENSKLQEEICNQIDKLRKASQQAEDNSKSHDQVLYMNAVTMAMYYWLYETTVSHRHAL